MASVTRTSAIDDSRRKSQDFLKTDDILQKFEVWFHQKHGKINIRHLYMGEVCSNRDKLVKGTTIIVSVIESEEAIANEQYEYDGRLFTVVYKLWGEISTSEEMREGSKHDNDKIKEITKYLKNHADLLFREHSNMEMIRPSLFKQKDKAKKIKNEPCIAIYLSYKGVVPVGEKEFQPKMGAYATDIREGFFHLLGNYDICANSNDQLDPLRMGASISKDQKGTGEGTLGGFVELNNGSVGFITCAHVLHTADEMQMTPSDHSFPVVQPSVLQEGSQHCGNLFKSAFPSSTIVDGVSVDATVVELIERIPDKAMFANLTTARLKSLGLSRSRLPRCSYRIRSIEETQDRSTEKTLKCGMMSGLTLGKVEVGEASARFRNISIKDGRFDTMYNSQLVIRNMDNIPFSVKGDSGAFVFQFKDINDLTCIGMIVGGDGQLTYITPITSVLEALSVRLKEF